MLQDTDPPQVRTPAVVLAAREDRSMNTIKGYLRKKSSKGRWQRRWFEASAHYLTYYKVRHRGLYTSVLSHESVFEILVPRAVAMVCICAGCFWLSCERNSVFLVCQLSLLPSTTSTYTFCLHPVPNTITLTHMCCMAWTLTDGRIRQNFSMYRFSTSTVLRHSSRLCVCWQYSFNHTC